MKNLEEFYEEVLKSKDLQKEFVSCKKDDDIKTFLSKYNCDAKVIDVKSFLQKKFIKEGKVDQKVIEELSGGGCAQGTIAVVDDVILTVGTVGVFCALKTILSKCDGEVGGELHEGDSAYCH